MVNIESTLEFISRKKKPNRPIKNYIACIFFLFLLISCSGTRPSLIGQFAPCPDKPNCVSSKSSLSLHKVAPITYKGTSKNAREIILKIIKSMPRTKIFVHKDNFIHTEFTSKLFRFVDDVEFYFENTGTIHIRSASRIGHSDMGVNRERLEDIRLLFDEIISGSIIKIPLNQL